MTNPDPIMLSFCQQQNQDSQEEFQSLASFMLLEPESSVHGRIEMLKYYSKRWKWKSILSRLYYNNSTFKGNKIASLLILVPEWCCGSHPSGPAGILIYFPLFPAMPCLIPPEFMLKLCNVRDQDFLETWKLHDIEIWFHLTLEHSCLTSWD